MNKFIFTLIILSGTLLLSCKPKTTKTETAAVKHDTVINLKLKTTPQASMSEEGMNTDYYENGKEKMKGMIKNGKREGLWQAWYENGNLWSEAEYTQGENNGKSVTYFENGKVRYEGKYDMGKKVGDWKYYDQDGKLVRTVKSEEIAVPK